MAEQKKWHKLESGQALMEYWPTIPAAIMIIISAGLVVSFLRGGFSQTAEVLTRSSAGVDYEVCETTDEQEIGPSETVVGTHLIEYIGSNFDGTNTTVVYRVTSSEAQALSHWVLGIPKAVADNIIDASEQYAWTDNDPKTGAVGIKFDTGYDGGGSSEEADSSEEDSSTEKTKGKSGKRTPVTSRMMNMYVFQTKTTTSIGFADGETREIFLVLSGQYEFEATTTVVTKSANETASGTVPAPSTIIDLGHTQTTIKEDCD